MCYFLAECSSAPPLLASSSKRVEDEGSRLLDSPAATFHFVLREVGIWQRNVCGGTFKRVPKFAIEWFYFLGYDKFIVLCSVMSGLPFRRKIVCAVVALRSAILWYALFTSHNPPCPAAVLPSPCLLPLFAPFVTAVPEMLPETSTIVLPLYGLSPLPSIVVNTANRRLPIAAVIVSFAICHETHSAIHLPVPLAMRPSNGALKIFDGCISARGKLCCEAEFASMLGDAFFTCVQLLFPCGLCNCSSVKFCRADSGSDAAND